MNDDDPLLNQPLDLPGGDDPLPHKNSQKKKRSPKKLLVGLMVFLLLLGLAAGVAHVLKNRSKATKAPSETTVVSDGAQQTTSNGDVPEAENTESFTSSPYRITFSFPKTWAVTEADDNGIRIESQKFTYKKTDGSEENGYFRIYIRKGARTQDGTIIGKGVAIAPSEKLKYTNPTSSQRKETNLSHFGLNKEDNFAYFLIAGNYELEKGDTLGPDFGKETETILIGGGYSGADLKDDLATNQVPIDWFKTTNAYKQAVEILQSLEIT